MVVWIRADGNEQIASGHLRRCLTIAECLVQEGAEVCFFVADEESADMLGRMLQEIQETQEKSFNPHASDSRDTADAVISCHILGVCYGHPMDEISLLTELQSSGKLSNAMHRIITDLRTGSRQNWRIDRKAVQRTSSRQDMCIDKKADQRTGSRPGSGPSVSTVTKPDWILVDSYAVDQSYYDALYKMFPGVRIACIDDLMKFDPRVDLVINYDPDTGALARFYKCARIKLLGPSYVPLREQFRKADTEINKKYQLLISTGGSDPYGMAPLLRDALVSQVTSGTDDTGIAITAPGYPYVNDMAGLMRECLLAVSAAGTTLYELCACGVPAISFSMSDNQKIFAEKMAAAGAIPYAGDVRDPSSRERVVEAVRQWFEKESLAFANAPARRRMKSEEMQKLVDGNGAARIAVSMKNSLSLD